MVLELEGGLFNWRSRAFFQYHVISVKGVACFSCDLETCFIMNLCFLYEFQTAQMETK